MGKKKSSNMETQSPPPQVDIEYFKVENKIKRMKKKQEKMKKQIEVKTPLIINLIYFLFFRKKHFF